MSRSFRHTPIYRPDSAKEFKQMSNRILRRSVRVKLQTCIDFDALVLPVMAEMSDIWGSPKDGGANLFGDRSDSVEKLMRK